MGCMIDKKTIQYLRTRLSDIENRRTLIIVGISTVQLSLVNSSKFD